LTRRIAPADGLIARYDYGEVHEDDVLGAMLIHKNLRRQR
jgi:hypothetical protein